jgi:group I intron endonuclease
VGIHLILKIDIFSKLKLLAFPKSKMGYIYKITNTLNNKCYIGITTKNNPNDRWREHINSIKYDNGCPLLVRAFNKHGIDNFKFEVIIICFDEDLYEYEKDYILKYKSFGPNGYNAHPGGEFGGNFKGRKHSAETKLKIGIKSSEYNSKEEVKQKKRENMIQFNKTHNIGELMRKSIKWQESKKNTRIRKELSDETKSKISKSVKLHFDNNGTSINKKKHSEIMTKINGRKIIQYSKDGQYINIFDSIILASKASGIGRCSIQANAAGRSNTAGGFIWKYAN